MATTESGEGGPDARGSVGPGPAPTRAGPPPFRVEHPMLLDAAGNDPVTIEALTFADNGIGMIRAAGDDPQVVPWDWVAAHVVEPWSGGVVPAWWVDPELNRSEPVEAEGVGKVGEPEAVGAVRGTGRGPRGRRPSPAGSVIDPAASTRPRPEADPGAVMAIQTRFGTYRFLIPGGNPAALSRRITDFAVRHQGLSGVPSVTTVARTPTAGNRRVGARAVEVPTRWHRVQTWLVVALVAVIASAATLIVLQSAGVVHLPFLGSPGSGASAASGTPGVAVGSVRTG